MSRVFEAGAGEKWTLAICLALMAALAGFVMVLSFGAASAQFAIGLLGVASAAPLVGLAILIADEAAAAFRLRIEIAGDEVLLRLPPRRGHVRRPFIETRLPLASIKAVETRAEAFRQLGIAAVQQAYRLILSDGSAIELGADRQMKAALFGPAAEAIAERLRQDVVDRGMVDGKAGLLAVVGTSVPEWSEPSLAPADVDRRRAAAARAFKIMAASMTLVMLVRLIARR